MKYGILFSTLAVLLAFFAFMFRAWFLFLLWPALSVGIVGLGYLGLGHRVFGKRPDGSMALTSVVVLLPYLLCLWTVWHVIRLVSREPSHNTLVDGVQIGRRLLSHEIPAGTVTVVDLTSEFPESTAMRNAPHYVSAPMLDASVLPAQELADLAIRIAAADSTVYIHCAQGHGRTGLIAALVLLALGGADDAGDALELVQSSRPKVRLNAAQRASLLDASSLVRPE